MAPFRSTRPRVGVTAAAFSVGLWLGYARHPAAASTPAIPITHVIMIMQENRSFDSYFGTYPGANGIPQGTCVPQNPAQPSLGCVVPFHDQHDVNAGGPHAAKEAMGDLDDGVTTDLMDGFVYQQTYDFHGSCFGKDGRLQNRTLCSGYVPGVNRHDVMGYHTAAEIPNYWAYAEHYVLQDQLYESARGWSGDAHLYMTSEWSAVCAKLGVLSTCTSALDTFAASATIDYPWVSLFQLMDSKGVSWKYYLGTGAEPDCEDSKMTCEPQRQSAGVLGLWNPAPGFTYVQQQGTAYLSAHNADINQFLSDVEHGSLAQVSWIVPSATFSEHPNYGVTAGMEYVTSLINAVMQSPYWNNTVIFLAWDDWGGFYDHVVPPIVDHNKTKTPVQGYGLRVPGLTISAYSRKAGYIDHNVLSFDSYATFIEDVFMNGTRLDPVAMGQPDSRPDVRDALTSVTFPNGTSLPIGNLMDEFEFGKPPRARLILSTQIPTGIMLTCGSADPVNPQICGTNSVAVTWQNVAGKYIPGPFTYGVLRDGGTQPVCTTTKTSCTDTGVPSGVHYYTAYSVDPSGVVSPPSAGAEADVP
jgi:phospholipase C